MAACRRQRLSSEGSPVQLGPISAGPRSSGTSRSGTPILLEVPDIQDFQIALKVLKMTKPFPTIGILPKDVCVKGLVASNFKDLTRGFFVDLTDGTMIAHGIPGRACKALALRIGQELRLRYVGGSKPDFAKLGVDGAWSELDFSAPVRSGDYYLYVLLCPWSSVEISLVEPRAKRCKVERADSLGRMWTDRDFTDAEIACDGKVIPAHRAVLCVASPVFAAAFKGAMSEANSACLRITDASAEAVESMMAHIYTGVLRAGTAAEVLPLAHRYQLDDLLADCCSQLVSGLSAENVASVTRALRPLRTEAVVIEAWERVVKRVSSDEALTRGLLETL
eukprot:TRINITY_DN38895_c0_g1_i1.p1 TRINITY_DN38895_c0_g1~~TRINITY_DN38895_c0_g1_i1.p1  ORF type:complete len:387 (+),score=61.35 TRINITY_DN38895_c0_g1_i1:155-1162(+)